MDLNRYRLPGLENRFTRAARNRAVIVFVQTPGHDKEFVEESVPEMRELCRAAGIRVLGEIRARLDRPSPGHFLREGKLSELKDEAAKLGANVLVFNADLAANQAANIETFTGQAALDRTGLILEIFGKRARSREGKLQVELAQLSYALPRIGGLGGVMSRMGGGIGARGPGEQELERDRRKIRLRIQKIKEDLRDVKKHRELIRSGRKRGQFLSAALVGYTNAGKTTLLNALTGAQGLVEDKMFATLDPMSRAARLPDGANVLFTDTVGFLRDLPHGLVEAFHATLEEVSEADLVIHVLDVSHPKAQELKEAVEKVLGELKAGGKPSLLVLNKADLLAETGREEVSRRWPEGILISASQGLGFQSLLAAVSRFAPGRSEEIKKNPDNQSIQSDPEPKSI